mgnify:FL=1
MKLATRIFYTEKKHDSMTSDLSPYPKSTSGAVVSFFMFE